jgi:hypothetical protein
VTSRDVRPRRLRMDPFYMYLFRLGWLYEWYYSIPRRSRPKTPTVGVEPTTVRSLL